MVMSSRLRAGAISHYVIGLMIGETKINKRVRHGGLFSILYPTQPPLPGEEFTPLYLPEREEGRFYFSSASMSESASSKVSESRASFESGGGSYTDGPCGAGACTGAPPSSAGFLNESTAQMARAAARSNNRVIKILRIFKISV